MKFSYISSSVNDPKPHGLLYKILIFLLIFSVGMGEVGSVKGIKPSYIVAILVAIVMLVNKIRSFYVTKNKYYLAYLAFMLIWGIYALIQGFFIEDSSLWAMYMKVLGINIFLVFVIIDYVREIGDVKFLLYCFLAYIAVCLAVGFFEIFADLHIVKVRSMSHGLPHSFYGNENDNAAVLIYGVYAILLCIFESKSQNVRLLLSAMLACTVFQIIMTDSRAAFLGLIMTACCTAFFTFLVWLAGRSKKAYCITVCAAFAFIVVFTSVIFIIFTPHELIELITTEGNLESDSLRVDLIISGIKAVFETYGFGLGAGQSILLNGINLHNFYLELFAEYGIIIGGMFCAFMLGIAFDLKGTEKKRSMLTDGLIRSFPVVMIVVGVGPSSTMKLRMTWIILSIIFAFKYIYESGNTGITLAKRRSDEL